MKTKIKRHSRSIVSVLLSVCMLISCMTVGLIATDAARISGDEAVGYDSSSDRIHIKIGSNWTDKYFSSSGETSFEVASDNTTIEFVYYVSGQWYKWESSSQATFNATDIKKATGQQRRAMVKGTSNYKVTGVSSGTYYVKITEEPKNKEMVVKIYGEGGSTTTSECYLYGNFNTFHWNGDVSQLAHMTYDSDTEIYSYEYTGTSTAPEFAVYEVGSSSEHWRPNISSGNETITVDNSTHTAAAKNIEWSESERLFTFSSTADTVYIIYFKKTSSSDAEVWVTTKKSPVVTSLTLKASKYSLTEVDETTNFTVTAEGLQSGVTNLTYKLFMANGTQVGSDVTVTNGSLTATFANVAPNVNMQGYYATVEETSSTTYKPVTSNPVTVTNSNEEYKASYTITYSSSDGTKGTVQAYDENGTAIASGSTVKEGKHVTFKASPANTSYRFKNWTGVAVTSGLLTDAEKTKSAITLTVYQDITLQGNFVEKGYTVCEGDYTSSNTMKELSNGVYISKYKVESGHWFQIKRLSDNYTSLGNNESGAQNISSASITNKKDVKWKQRTGGWNQNENYNGSFKNNSSDLYYVVYDPVEDKVWLTGEDDAQYAVKVIAKDGTIRTGYNTTDLFGDTTITVESNPAGGTLNPYDDQDYDSGSNHAQTVDLTAAQARQGVKLKIRTTIKSGYTDYFVKGFDVNGGETQGIISQEFGSDGAHLAQESYSDSDAAAKIYGNYNEFTIDIQGYEDSVIEITPIYYKKEVTQGENIRFIVDGFDGDVKKAWNGNIACYGYKSNSTKPYGDYPGQPMVCIGGRYMMELPRSLTSGITLNNYVWDYTHAQFQLGNTSSGTIEAANRQTYDYDEFKVINDIFTKMQENDPKHEWPDEDIIFSFKPKPESTLADSNLGAAIYYDSDTENTTYTVNGVTKGYSSTYEYGHIANTIDPNNFTFENLTNFYGERVDLLGNLVDKEENDNRYENPLLVISNGYDWNKVGNYATAWAIYKPTNATGNPGTYTLAEVIGGLGKLKDFSGTSGQEGDLGKYNHYFDSESYLINPASRDMDIKYYEEYESDPRHIVTLQNKPTMICYENEIRSGYSNLEAVMYGKTLNDTNSLNDGGQRGYRMDGRWYYSKSNQMVKSHVLIEYRESGIDTYTRDYFQPDNIDYKVDGYDKSKNTGLSTGISAYFTNSGTVSDGTSSYTNSLGSTEAAAITDGEMTFDLVTTPDLNGDYTFEGWYLLNNGKYTFVSDEFEYTAEALTNDVYVARYVKAPSGVVNITHGLTSDSTGKASTKLQVSVIKVSDSSTVFDFEETTGGQIVNSTYIKKDETTPKALKITLTNTPDKYSVFNTFKENITGTLAVLNGTTHPSIATGATITTGTDNTCVIIIPINNLFSADGEHDQTIKALPFFSKVDLIHRHYKVEFEYKSRKTDLKDDNSRMWGTQSYSVEGTITDSDYNSGYFDLTDDSDKKAVLSTKKAEFLAKICPYEENFKENITWDFNDATKISSPTYSREDEDNDKVRYTVTANYSDDNIISYKFRFPFEYTGPTTTDGVITFTPTETTITVDEREVTDAVMYIDPTDVGSQSRAFKPQLIYTGTDVPDEGELIYQDWVSLNSIHNSAEAAAAITANAATTEPVFVTAPEKLYKAVTEGGDTTYKEMQFKYWSIRPYTNTGAESEIYKKCYNKEFNFALYQDAEITAEYEEVPDTPAEPEEPEESGEPEEDTSRITTYISHDQNSRTQWNDNYGTANTAYTYYTAADRIFVDFMVNYEYKGQTLKELTAGNNPDNVRVGVILVRTDELDTDDVKTNAEYKDEYETGDNVAAHSTEADGYITKIMNGTEFTPAESAVCKKSGASVNVTALDNKNMMDYAYSYANISQSTLKPTEHKNYLYRAYSYLIYETTDNGVTTKHFVKSAPEYFTFYDIASISGEEIVHNTPAS